MSGRHAKPRMAADKKTANVTSFIRSLEATLIHDPEGLRYVPLILQAASEARTVAISTIMDREIVPRSVLADIMGCSPSNVTQHRNAGREVIEAREALAGIERFPAAKIDSERRKKIAEQIAERLHTGDASGDVQEDERLAG